MNSRNLAFFETRTKNLRYFRSCSHETFWLTILRWKNIFEPLISIDQGKAKVSSKWTTNQDTLCFVESLPWLVIEIRDSKLSFYLNIFIPQYCVQICLVWIRLLWLAKFRNIFIKSYKRQKWQCFLQSGDGNAK